MIKKQCGKCMQILSIDEFYRHSGRPDGYSDWCRECTYERKQRLIETPEEIFEKNVRREEGEDGCWIWQGSLDVRGRPQFFTGNKRTYVHRMIYEKYYGDVGGPKNRVIQTCGNNRCCNPKHLLLKR